MRKDYFDKYSYLLNGGKLYYDFTEDEKEFYRQYMQETKKRQENFRWNLAMAISIIALIASFLRA